MTEDPTRTPVLVLGITGSIGKAIALALHRRGHPIAALTRDPDAAARHLPPGLMVRWHKGDALDGAAVRAAAAGAGVIVHAVNPPGYQRWREDAVPMLAHTIVAAEAAGALVVFPGNVYVYSPASGSVVDERTPFSPQTRKGAVRRDLEMMLRAAGERGVRSLVIRAGDFFGHGVTNSWFAGAMATKGMASSVIQSLGTVGHAWAYVPDLAEATAQLIDVRGSLATAEVVHFGGHYDATGGEMATAIQRALAPRRVPIRRFSWTMMRLGAPFVSFLREAIEMRWLWEHPLRLDNAKLERLIGPEPHTPLDAAVAAALAAPTPPVTAARPMPAAAA
jgi:nucleoside-diphosphate-sugar epimerase